MKNIGTITMGVIMIVLTLVSCKREDSPETVTKKFANHFVAGEYELAANYGTESTRELLNMMESLASVGFHEEEEDNFAKYTDDDISCVISEDGLTAACTYLDLGELAEVRLSRVEGKWLVDISLDDLFYDEEDWYEDEDDDWLFDGSEAQLD